MILWHALTQTFHPTAIIQKVRLRSGRQDHVLMTKPERLTDLSYVIELRPPSDFRYEAGREKLIDLRIGAWNGPDVQYIVPGDASRIIDTESEFDAEKQQDGRDARLIKLSGWVSVDSRHSVSMLIDSNDIPAYEPQGRMCQCTSQLHQAQKRC